jgi:TatD DNase family protein
MPVTLADSHAHLTDSQFEPDLESVLERAVQAGVKYMLTIGTSADDSALCVELARRHHGVFAAAGIQPHSAHRVKQKEIEALADVAKSDRIVALGETGLEYHYYPDKAVQQKELVREHIRIAGALKKPVIYHCRKADEDMLALLDEEKAWDVGGVMHCFSGSQETARRCLDMGLYLSFAGPVTFPASLKLQEIAAETPLERILVETDAPYLAPVPHRGKRNEPAYVTHTAAALAKLKGVPDDVFFRAVTENFRRLFGIDTGEPKSR